MEKGIHKVYEEMLGLMLEKNEKIYQFDSLFDEFTALDEALLLLQQKADNLLKIKESYVTSVKTVQDAQRITIKPIKIAKDNKASILVIALLGLLLSFALWLFVSEFRVKEFFAVR